MQTLSPTIVPADSMLGCPHLESELLVDNALLFPVILFYWGDVFGFLICQSPYVVI